MFLAGTEFALRCLAFSSTRKAGMFLVGTEIGLACFASSETLTTGMRLVFPFFHLVLSPKP